MNYRYGKGQRKAIMVNEIRKLRNRALTLGLFVVALIIIIIAKTQG